MASESINDLNELSHPFSPAGLCEFCGEKAKFEHMGFAYCVDCAEETYDECENEISDLQWQLDELSKLIEENKDG